MTLPALSREKIRTLDGLELETIIYRAGNDSAGGVVVLAHGITADMDAGGMFVRLARRLAEQGLNVLRFSFRGHGNSGGGQRGVTIAGEMLDLEAQLSHAREIGTQPVCIVAASFAAASLSMLLPYAARNLRCMVLWNPVLDLRRTFIMPETPWGQRNFGLQQSHTWKRTAFFCWMATSKWAG